MIFDRRRSPASGEGKAGKNQAVCDYTLFLYLFVYCGLLAPLAVLFELNFTLHLFAVFATPVVNSFACAAGELDEVIL